jgi:hypothetical protein
MEIPVPAVIESAPVNTLSDDTPAVDDAAQDGTPDPFSVKYCDPELLPGSVTQFVPFQ